MATKINLLFVDDEEKFLEATTKRLEARDQQRNPNAPECSQCGNSMRQRKSIKGEFWGCSAYPDCKGTRPISPPNPPTPPNRQ